MNAAVNTMYRGEKFRRGANEGRCCLAGIMATAGTPYSEILTEDIPFKQQRPINPYE